MTTVVLVRHPRPVLPAFALCYGRLELELRSGWQAEVDALVLPPQRDAVVWTSPSRRCAQPAARLGARLGLEVRPDERLQELDFGDWEGLAWDRVPREALDLWAADLPGFAPPGGESGAALIARISEFHAMLRQAPGSAIVMAHGGPLRVLSPLLRDRPVDLSARSMGFLGMETLTLPGHSAGAQQSVSRPVSASTEQAPSTSPVWPPR